MDVVLRLSRPLRARGDAAVRERAALTTAAVALTGMAAAVGASASADDPTMDAAFWAIVVGVPLAAGIYARTLPSAERLARLLLVAGLAAFVMALAETGDEVLDATGQAAAWLLCALLATIVLGFPAGRLERRDRALAAAVVGAGVLDALGTGALAGALLIGTVLAVAARLAVHVRDAPPAGRRALEPLAVAGLAVGLLLVAGITWDGALGGAGSPGVLGGLVAAATPVLACAAVIGLVRWRLFCEAALRRLATVVGTAPDVPALRRALADTLHDPTVDVVVPPPGPPVGTSGRGVLPVRHRGAPVAAILHDPALDDHPELLQAAAHLAAVTLENQQLVAEAEAAAREARESRARIAATADAERRRIERDLHDGAQQRLVALRIELGIAEDLAREDPERCAARLRTLETAVDDALQEIRTLAHGVCPPLLADRGLGEAIRAAASRAAIPVALEVRGSRRFAPEVEIAVFFCVLEALQNVAKHATGARRVTVTLDGRDPEQLRFSVRDDGPGAWDPGAATGAGLLNMRDRLGALDGELQVVARAGIGTTVRGRVPVGGVSRR
jgi:signal transduction histidine kinase